MRARCALYARYSSDLQREASIEDQFRACAVRAEREGWQVVATFHDADISGTTTLRPGYQSLLKAMRAGSIDIVLAESLDRFSRDLEHVAGFYKQTRLAQVRLVTLSEGEISELHIGLKGTMGALYLKDLADKTLRGLVGRVRQGRSVGRVQYGYRAIRGQLGPDGEPERGLREPDPVASEVVRRIFDDYASGKSAKAIARALNAEGISGPDGELWNDSTIRGRPSSGSGILRAEVYAGRLVWNRQRTLRNPENGQRHHAPNTGDEVVTCEVPALRLIDPAVWQAVQARLARHRPALDPGRQPRFWEQRRPRHLLTGKVACGCCDRAFEAIGRDYLACRGVRRGVCRNNSRVRRARLEGQVLAALGTRLMDPTLAKAFAEAFIEEWNRCAQAETAAGAGKRTELAQVERKIANLVDALADGASRGGAVAAKLVELEGRRDELRQQVEALPSQRPHLHPDLGRIYRDRVAQLRDAMKGDDSAEAREAARALIDRVVVSPPPEGGGPPGIELVGDLREMLRTAGASGMSTEGDTHDTGCLDLVLSSVKVRRGAEPSPSRPVPSLAPVRPVDVDIAMRQVAGPNGGLALAETDIDGDLHLAPLHVVDDRRLVVAIDHAAVARHPGAAHGDGQLVAVGRLARLAHRHDDAAPIRVLAGDRGLHQR